MLKVTVTRSVNLRAIQYYNNHHNNLNHYYANWKVFNSLRSLPTAAGAEELREEAGLLQQWRHLRPVLVSLPEEVASVGRAVLLDVLSVRAPDLRHRRRVSVLWKPPVIRELLLGGDELLSHRSVEETPLLADAASLRHIAHRVTPTPVHDTPSRTRFQTL